MKLWRVDPKDGLGKPFGGPQHYKIRPTNDEVFIRRIRLFQTPWCSVFIHEICTENRDVALHDHPWTFWSFMLWGGYSEVVHKYPNQPKSKGRTHRRWSLHKLSLYSTHRIVSVKPHTWTLLVTGKRRQRWGFWLPEGWMDFRQYYLKHPPMECERFQSYLEHKGIDKLDPIELEYLESGTG